MTEPEVFELVASYLDSRSYTFFVHIPDAHEEHYATTLEKYKQHRITIDGLYPDILGRTPAGKVFAVEVKGSKDVERGVNQALVYRDGVHFSYLAAPDASLNGAVGTTTQDIGFLSVEPDGTIDPQEPNNVQIKESLFDVETRLRAYSERNTTSGNITGMQLSQPLNYIAPVLALTNPEITDKDDIVRLLAETHDFHEGDSATAGAIELGLISRGKCSLTDQGKIAVSFFRGEGIHTLSELYGIKEAIPAGGALCQTRSTLAVFLRELFRRHPDFELLYEAIGSFEQPQVTFPQVLERLVTQYPNVFLNLFCRPSERATAITYLQSADRSRLYEDDTVWRSLVRQNVVHNFTHQLKHLGVLMPRTTAHPGSMDEYDPKEHPWLLEYNHGYW